MRIYFAHSICDKGSAYEAMCIEKIKDIFCVDDKIIIINPFFDIKIDKSDMILLRGGLRDYLKMMRKYFYPEIDRCDVLIAFRASMLCGKWEGKYTDGVQREIRHAEDVGIKVVML